jgi:hypothetical protein
MLACWQLAAKMPCTQERRRAPTRSTYRVRHLRRLSSRSLAEVAVVVGDHFILAPGAPYGTKRDICETYLTNVST